MAAMFVNGSGQNSLERTFHRCFLPSFTSAIRTGLKFSGNEKITVGGGEELWVFINKVLVIEIIADRSATDVVCQTIDFNG
jgi:fibro-slime domain-containing protein